MMRQGIGRYEIIRPLGKGGMGEVYLARDPALGREVALKLLPDELMGSAERRKRFEREARTLAAVNHPNITTIYSVEEEEGVGFITMERVDGRTLAEILESGRLSFERLLAVAEQIAAGLAEAHRAGIVHRDLKPLNIMVTKTGLVKILDFGLAKPAVTLAETRDAYKTTAPLKEDSAGASQAGVIVGTIPYMSPEQALGEAVDQRSDVFSLGGPFF